MLRLNFKRRCALALVTLLAAIAAAGSARAATAADDATAAALALLPAETQAAIVIPSLKRLSDQVTQCLEGMDRANILMGSRPIDQLKAATGFNVGINDAGALAIVLVQTAEGRLSPHPAFVIPVSDAQGFLEGNFVEHDGDAHETHGGQTVYARAIGSHVVLAYNSEIVRSYQPSKPDEMESLKASIGERGLALAMGGDLFVFGRAAAFAELLRTIKEQSARQDARLPGIAVAALTMMEDVDGGLTSIDFDPLGLIMRSFGRFKPGSDGAKLAGRFGPDAGRAGRADLYRLPNKPFHLAFSINLAAAGAGEDRQALMDLAGPSSLWLAQIEGVQLAAYPSPAGLNGGLLNDAALVLRTATPEALRQSLRDLFGLLRNNADGVKREVSLEIDKPVKDCGLADAYEIKVIEAPPEQAMQQMAERLAFGTGARRGFIAATGDSVIVTFSQRPAVLGAALQAATADAEAKQNLESAAVIKIMRQWMPANSIAELYIGVGRLLEFVGAAAAAIPQAQEMFPRIDPNAPPIGLAVAAADGGIESSAVIPSAILSALFDQAMKQQAGRGPVHAAPLDPAAIDQDRD